MNSKNKCHKKGTGIKKYGGWIGGEAYGGEREDNVDWIGLSIAQSQQMSGHCLWFRIHQLLFEAS